MKSHNIGDIDELKKYKYCYLNNIYKNDDNNIHVFELLLTNKLFTKFVLYLTNGRELRQIIMCKELIKDFSIVDGVLKYSNTNILPLYDGIENDLFKIKDISPEKKTLFDLFREGVLNNYILIEDSIVTENQDNYVGSEFTKFSNIKFSNNTMSIYARIVTEDGLYNKMLVTMKNGVFKVSQFYFGIPVTEENSDLKEIGTMSFFNSSSVIDKKDDQKNNDSCVKFFGEEYCKNMVINGDQYKVYYLRMSILHTQTSMINSLINKAASMCVKFTNICNALEFFISEQYSGIYKDQKRKEWIGGNADYNDGVGVYLTSSRKVITKKDDRVLLGFLCDAIKRNTTSDGIVEWIKNSGFSDDEKQIMMIYFSFLLESDKPLERINLAYTYKDKIDLYYVCFSCYLYEVRLSIFKDDTFLLRNQTNFLQPVMVNGSDEKCYTIIQKSGSFTNL